MAQPEDHYIDEKTKLFWCSVITFLLLVLLLPVGFLRRRFKSMVLKGYASGIYACTYLLIPYTLGLVNNILVDPLLLASLVFMYGSVDKVNAIDLNHRVGMIWVKNLAYSVFALYAGVQMISHRLGVLKPTASRSYNILISFPLLVRLLFACQWLYSIYKILERVSASRYASGNDQHLTSLLRHVSNNLPNDHMVPESSIGPSDDPLTGCKYVVNPHYKGKSTITTVDKILNCQDDEAILSCTGDPSSRLKSTCLSFSLFWLLLHRFTGIPSYECSHQEEAWKFVKHGMLIRPHTSSFTTIEVELALLYDFFYSKYFVFYLKGFRCQMLKQLVFHWLFTSIVAVAWSLSIRSISSEDIALVIAKIFKPSMYTILITTEVVQFMLFLNSRWSKMMLICMYLKRESWKKQNIWDCFIKKAAQLICPVRCEWPKPWQRKLGQYSLLESYSSRHNFLWRMASVTTRAFLGAQIVLPGRKESHSINLTDDIKKVVLESLCKHDTQPQLSNGIASLKGNDQLASSVRRKLVCASKQLKTDAQAILVWHIATSFCEINPQPPQTERDLVHFHVATSLSKYCAYLVAFAPELLPDNAANTDHICTMAIKDVYTSMKDCKSSRRYDKLLEIAGDAGEPEAGQIVTSNVLELGAVLGKVLDTEITDASKRWKALADFWAEMMLYLAPNANNEWAHARMLADGGEFITHLWVLLFHAGIVDRDFVRKAEVSTSSETNTTSI